MKKLRRHVFIFPIFFFLFLIYLWFSTTGNWDILARTKFRGLEKFYDSQAKSLLYGHLSVDRASAGCEAFLIDGRIHTYFGITPSLIRIILNSFFPFMEGSWNRLIILVYSFGSLLIYYIIINLFIVKYNIFLNFKNKVLLSLYFIVLGLGSSNLFMACIPTIYYEAMSCSIFFSLASYYNSILYIHKRQNKNILLSFLFSMLAINARPIPAFGSLGLIFIILTFNLLSCIKIDTICHSMTMRLFQIFDFKVYKERIYKTIIYFIIALIVLMSAFLVNYAKFHSFTKLPMDKYISYMRAPQRLDRTGGGNWFSIKNVTANLHSYFAPTGLDYTGKFPWIDLKYYTPEEILKLYPNAVLDSKEWTVGLPLASPLLFLLTIIGLFICFKPGSKEKIFRAPIISSFIGSSPIFLLFYIAHRYIQDFFPLILFSCSAAMIYLMTTEEKYTRYIIYPFVALGVVNIFINIIICMSMMNIYIVSTGYP